jgi:muramoyltetrapeptide carboxypeptidase
MQPLKYGDEIRIIAPSARLKGRADALTAQRAKTRLEELGYKISHGKSVDAHFHLETAQASERAKDFNEAFYDKNVKAIMALSGGWSANEILPIIDWDVVKANPKPMSGFSDNTVLINALYAKADFGGLLGPNFSTVGRMISWQYTLEHLDMVLRQQWPIELQRSNSWGESRKSNITKPWKCLQPGETEAILVGGNLGSFYLLQGTQYQPRFDEPFILLAEDDNETGKYSAQEFSRRLESILQLPNVRKNIAGMLIGRFQPGSKMTENHLKSIIASKNLPNIPIAMDIDFGHSIPMLTLPIGGKMRLKVDRGKVQITLLGY